MGAAGTTAGNFSLNTDNGSPITISSKVGGALSSAGLSAGTYEANVAQTVTKARSAATAAPAAGTTGLLNGNTLIINDVQIDAAIAIDDHSSDAGATSSTKAASGIAIAAAINKKTEMTGVTATAEANQVRGSSFEAGAVTKLNL